MPLYAPAQWLPTTHFDKGPTTKKYIILHGTGYSLSQTAADVAHDFQTTNPNSTHFAVDLAGDVAQMVDTDDVAWGNGIVQAGPNHGSWWDTGPNPNQDTISIETVNDSGNSQPLTPAQQAATFELVVWLCRIHNIPMRAADANGGITGHFSIESVDRASCPGPNFPWQPLWDFLKGVPVYNIPSNDTGVVLVPGQIETFCEWLVTMAGGIATCVESSEMMVNHLVNSGFPVSAQEDINLAQDLINRGEASPNGATNYVAASNQMTRLGIPNDAYGQSWFAANDFVPVVQDAIRRGIPVLFGLSAAYNAHDDWTNSTEDAGVDGHGIAIVGMDSTGAICADPNTSQAKYGQFVHYSWADLKAMGGAWPSMVIPRGAMMLSLSDAEVAKYFKQGPGNSWVCTKNGFIIHDAVWSFYLTMGGAYNGLAIMGLPLSDEIWGKTPANTCYQIFERGVLVYDQAHVLDFPPGAGMVYVGKTSQFEPPAPAPGTEPDADDAQIAALTAQVASLQAQLAKSQVPPDLHAALAAAAQLLNPSAQAAAQVAAVMKELGY